MRIWDALGFKRVGRIKGCGNLKSYPHELVDAIIYGRELGPEAEDYVSEERFEKIRFYLKEGKYPLGADRAEKSRLRSAATHYKLLPAEDEADRGREDSERLMLKDKEVISDPKRQYDIARSVHQQSHGGINKTTATIAEKYHWVRIKETVSLVIKNCHECKDSAQKNPTPRRKGPPPEPPQHVIDKLLSFSKPPPPAQSQAQQSGDNPGGSSTTPPPNQPLFAPIAPMQSNERYTMNIPLDPQIVHGNRENPEDQQNRAIAEGLQRIEDFNRTGNTSEQQFESPMDVDRQEPSQQQDDTRMASKRHMRRGDDPLSYQQPEGTQVQVRNNQQLYDRYGAMES